MCVPVLREIVRSNCSAPEAITVIIWTGLVCKAGGNFGNFQWKPIICRVSCVTFGKTIFNTWGPEYMRVYKSCLTKPIQMMSAFFSIVFLCGLRLGCINRVVTFWPRNNLCGKRIMMKVYAAYLVAWLQRI